MPNRVISSNFVLQRAIDQLSKFYSIPSIRDLSETIGLREITGLRNSVSSTNLRPPERIVGIIDSLINSSLGAIPTTKKLNADAASDSYYDLIQELVTGGNSDDVGNRRDLGDLASKINILLSLGEVQQAPLTENIIQNQMKDVLGNLATNNIDRKLSAINIKFPQISLNQKFSEAITLFLNALPTIELARAVPYVEITFVFNRQALDENGRLNAPSLLKFLEGAADISSNTTAKFIVEANRIPSSDTNNPGLLSLAGMELFGSPATLTNFNSSQAGEFRPISIKDPFRPFMTFKSLAIDVAPSVGMFSFKTAKLSFVLHDASRTHEIAEFVKPDLYSTTEILLEYGWKHPDGDRAENPYADLLNASRQKEKYGIRNIQLSLDVSRQANIVLDLFTKGATDLATEVISSTDAGITNTLRTVQRLSEAIHGYSRLGNRAEGSSRTQEIRGIQFLNTASDWQGLLNLSPGDLANFRQLTETLRRMRDNQQATDLSNTLTTLLGEITGRGRSSTTQGGAVTQLRQTVANQIREKLENLSGVDTFVTEVYIPDREGRNRDPVNLQTSARGANSTTARNNRSQSRPQPNAVSLPAIPVLNRRGTVSLAKILLTFVGLPLAATNKFTEVQFLFYPFNPYAGNASKYTTGQFLVDINFFYEKYVQFRLENLSRSANVSLQDFVSFLASTIIDDPVAPLYGIDSLYERQNNRANGNQPEYAPSGNELQFQANLERRLRGVTPDGSFRMPQVSFYIEALPIRRGVRENSNQEPDVSQTILRIHVFDKQTTPYAGQAAILQATREGVIDSLQNIHTNAENPDENTTTAVQESQRTALNDIINRASSAGILEIMNNSTNAQGMRTYQVRGGQTAIKKFLMQTMPYAIYGTQNTGIVSAQLSTIQDPALSTVNMLRSNNGTPLRSNGEQPGGLPLSIVPCELSMETIGCPLFSFGQQMFLDFGTGTSMDNIYGVSGLSHNFEPGSFKTSVKLVPFDAYGKYASFTSRINRLVTVLDHNLQQSQTGTVPAQQNGTNLSPSPGSGTAIRRG